ncbi:MAG: hypothetical protein J3R72DRAFT_435965 [Linnemannia gamsii]|nr:MAG: hypothetical protein J3R72DRAFT_435965 [Linnemannia gamsii]
MSTTTPVRTPFDLPELRHRLSGFVTLKDALSCALVCKAWSTDFMSAIWFQVDFVSHPQFADLSPDIVSKHGHLTRIVKNAKSPPQVSVLANAGVNNLRGLHMEQTASAIQHVQVYEIISRNSRTLKEVHLFSAKHVDNKLTHSTQYVYAPGLLPSTGPTPLITSKLKALKLESLCITYDSLVAILQGCPMLTEVRLPRTDMVGNPTQSFQHTGVSLLSSSLKSLFQPPSTGPSLLSYFPRLTILATFNYDTNLTIPSSQIKEDLLRYCPDVTKYRLEGHTGAIVSEFLLNIADNCTEVTYAYKHTSLEVITGLLLHHPTLEAVHQYRDNGFDYEAETVLPLSDHYRQSGRFVQLIPRGCSLLKSLNLSSHEMDMDVVEVGKWTCKDLHTLRIRIKDLDTREKILKTIALWRKGCWRRWREQAGTPVGEEGKLDEADMSIEARVARHLLQFEQLWWVWLGYQVWSPI